MVAVADQGHRPKPFKLKPSVESLCLHSLCLHGTPPVIQPSCTARGPEPVPREIASIDEKALKSLLHCIEARAFSGDGHLERMEWAPQEFPERTPGTHGCHMSQTLLGGPAAYKLGVALNDRSSMP